MNFTCNGTIGAVRVVTTVTGTDRGMAVSGHGQQKNDDQNPMLQIWRKINANESGIFYHKMVARNVFDFFTCINLDNNIDKVWVSRNATILNCTAAADKGLISVQYGDILGIELPPIDIDQEFELVFSASGPRNYIFSGRMLKNVNLNLKEYNYHTTQQPQIQFNILTKTGII